MTETLTLYHYWRSSCSWRVRWALLHKNLAFEKVHIHLLKDEQKQAAYLAINPSGLVPALRLGDKVLSESLAIIEWLEERYPEHPLLPQDLWMRAKARELSLLVAAGIQPLQNLRASHRHSTDLSEREAWTKWAISSGLEVLEKQLSAFSGPFALGEQLSLADLFLVPQIYNAQRNQIDMSLFPRCHAIYQHCLTLPDCDAASPAKQAEAT